MVKVSFAGRTASLHEDFRHFHEGRHGGSTGGRLLAGRRDRRPVGEGPCPPECGHPGRLPCGGGGGRRRGGPSLDALACHPLAAGGAPPLSPGQGSAIRTPMDHGASGSGQGCRLPESRSIRRRIGMSPPTSEDVLKAVRRLLANTTSWVRDGIQPVDLVAGDGELLVEFRWRRNPYLYAFPVSTDDLTVS